MVWLTGILELLKALLAAVPIFNKWFSKTPTEKIEDAKKDLAKEMDKFKEDGRPSWD